MSADPALRNLRLALERELVEDILPYWLVRAVDHDRGGFVGLIDAEERAHPDAPRGAVLTARILWTFSAAYRALGRATYLAGAERALGEVRERFLDEEHGGVYWMVSAEGAPLDARKHVYAQAFAIYALAEHARATGDAASLGTARELFGLVERHAHDDVHGGYAEAFARDWSPLDDVRLSAADEDAPKSMNTHLHVLEAYAALYRVWPDPLLRARLAEVIDLFLDHVVDARAGRLRLFFEADWTPRAGATSFGHDVEASWLLLDAADALGSAAVRARVLPAAVRVAEQVLADGYDAERGGLFYERALGGRLDTDKEWWPQAEAIVGFVAAWQATGRPAFRDAASGTWAFVRRHVLDAAHGEWRRRVAADGTPRPGHEKVGPWKCPYHNARACLEVMTRVDGAAGATAA